MARTLVGVAVLVLERSLVARSLCMSLMMWLDDWHSSQRFMQSKRAASQQPSEGRRIDGVGDVWCSVLGRGLLASVTAQNIFLASPTRLRQ